MLINKYNILPYSRTQTITSHLNFFLLPNQNLAIFKPQKSSKSRRLQTRMARTKTSAREVAGRTKELVVGIRQSPRAGQSERVVAGQSKERTVGPSRVPRIEGDNAEVHKLISCGSITVYMIFSDQFYMPNMWVILLGI